MSRSSVFDGADRPGSAVQVVTISDTPPETAVDLVRPMHVTGAVEPFGVEIVQRMHQVDRRLVQIAGYGRGAHTATHTTKPTVKPRR